MIEDIFGSTVGTHTPRWMAQGMGYYQGLCIRGGKVKKFRKNQIKSDKNSMSYS